MPGTPCNEAGEDVFSQVVGNANAGVVPLAPGVVLHPPETYGCSAGRVHSEIEEEVAWLDVDSVRGSAGEDCGGSRDQDVVQFLFRLCGE